MSHCWANRSFNECNAGCACATFSTSSATDKGAEAGIPKPAVKENRTPHASAVEKPTEAPPSTQSTGGNDDEDDFAIDFGMVRYRTQGSAGGNNGLKSIIASLGTTEFPRLRIGTGNDTLRQKLGDMDFVLSKFTPEEKAQLPNILREVTERINEFIA